MRKENMINNNIKPIINSISITKSKINNRETNTVTKTTSNIEYGKVIS